MIATSFGSQTAPSPVVSSVWEPQLFPAHSTPCFVRGVTWASARRQARAGARSRSHLRGRSGVGKIGVAGKSRLDATRKGPMADRSPWEVPSPNQPKPEELAFDRDHA